MGNKRVLIIDDDKEFLEELKEALELSGYESVAVNDASQARETARTMKPDVVLLDLKMPKKSGVEVADELRRSPDLSEVPIIAMSGCYKDGDFPLLKVHGITTCLNKPFNPTTIIAEISSLLKE